MSQYSTPTIATHVPMTADIPKEDVGLMVGRPDAYTPSLWQHSVKVKHKVTGKPAVVVRVDWGTNMFRAFYPHEPNNAGDLGRFAERTEWEHCRDWDVETTYSPAELERQAARVALEAKIGLLDAKQIALAKVLCDDEDANKALSKLEMLIQSGLIQMPAEIAPEVVGPRRRAKAEPSGEGT